MRSPTMPADDGPTHVSTPLALLIAFGEGTRGVFRQAPQSAAVVATIALGVGLALAISAIGRAVDANVSSLLAAGPLPAAFKIDSITRTLDESQRVFTLLAFFYTAALVVAVTVLSLRSLRREVGVKRQVGVHPWEVVVELMVRAALLCLAGGVAGLALGRLLCAWLNGYFTALVVRPSVGEAVSVFGIGVGVGMAAICILALFQAFRPLREQPL